MKEWLLINSGGCMLWNTSLPCPVESPQPSLSDEFSMFSTVICLSCSKNHQLLVELNPQYIELEVKIFLLHTLSLPYYTLFPVANWYLSVSDAVLGPGLALFIGRLLRAAELRFCPSRGALSRFNQLMRPLN